MSEQQPLIQYTTVSDSVYLWIKNAIIQGEFKPGEHIAQERLTKKLGVSRTPVRDAIKRLELSLIHILLYVHHHFCRDGSHRHLQYF